MNNSGTRILIVEDSAIQAEALRRILDKEGYTVSVAKDGAEGLSKAKELKPELVVSDIVMPGMNGFELCRHIKDAPDIGHTPVILLTSLSDPADVISGLECGADNFIVKPYDDHQLLSRIKQILLNRELQENSRTQMGVEIHFAGQKYFITSEKKQILDLLLSTYESAVQKNVELIKVQEELKILNEELEQKVQERTEALTSEIEERKRSDELIKSILESIDEGFILIDRDYRILMANRAYADQIKMPLEDIIGQYCYKLSHNHDKPCYEMEEECAVKQVFDTGMQHVAIYKYNHSKGIPVYIETKAYPLSKDESGKVTTVIEILVDITEKKKLNDRQQLAHEVLELLNHSEITEHTISYILSAVQKRIGLEAVAIRLREGEDFPYYVTNGFPEDFVLAGRFLCARDTAGEIVRDSKGDPVIDCMCGNILRGQANPALPFFTKGGSFWTSSTTKLLASTTEADRQTLNLCNDGGYESVALIPLRTNREIIGLLQLNDHRPDQFTPEMITFIEALGASIGIALTRKQAEQALREREGLLHSLFDNMTSGAAIFKVINDGSKGSDYIIKDFNATSLRIEGKQKDEVIGKSLFDLRPNIDQYGLITVFQKVWRIGEPGYFPPKIYRDEKYNNWYENWVFKLPTNEIVAIYDDVTESKKLEDQLRHAQKMEAVGTLAGGIAHDFNNILNVIMGYGGMVYDGLEAGSPQKEQMNEVLTAAERAANLTKRLLVFSRKQVVAVKPVNINGLILGVQKMLVRMLREDINFKLELAARPLIVMADSGQIEQVLMNLVTNARDVMPEGGSLTIGTGLQELDDEYVALYGFGKIGRYALITVTDTGQGMNAETQKKIFEPFFTTKGIGEGTGLGLSISYAIIKQHSGYINVYSEPGQGTVFKVYLPLSEEAVFPDKKTVAAVPAKGGNETILVAEDDASLMQLMRIVLESFGYSVITAKDGDDAITKFMENRERISLVLLDMIMPKKNGKEVGETIRKVSPRIKILFASGYTMDIIKTKELTDAGFDFISKPVLPRDLLLKVREVLDR
ncbi:MAG: response regulator [Nitrospirae bacterium]|nr:response regulator [Nitrospirota bacterium]